MSDIYPHMPDDYYNFYHCSLDCPAAWDRKNTCPQHKQSEDMPCILYYKNTIEQRNKQIEYQKEEIARLLNRIAIYEVHFGFIEPRPAKS